MERRIVFLAGVHGVGKSTLAREVSKFTGIPFYAASALIRAYKQRPIDHGKVAIDPDDNQKILSLALADVKDEVPIIGLDGHFVLRGASAPYEVPDSLFESLAICGICLATGDSSVIYERLRDRDGSSALSEDEIRAISQLEALRAKAVAKKLAVPFLEVTSDNWMGMARWVQALTGSWQGRKAR